MDHSNIRLMSLSRDGFRGIHGAAVEIVNG